jgi:hypothetical protein
MGVRERFNDVLDGSIFKNGLSYVTDAGGWVYIL